MKSKMNRKGAVLVLQEAGMVEVIAPSHVDGISRHWNFANDDGIGYIRGVDKIERVAEYKVLFGSH